LKPHAALCVFYGVCIAPDVFPAIVTEFVSGGNLRNLLNNTTMRIGDADVVSLGKDLCSGVAHLHDSGILHCDIATRNLLVTGFDPARLRICDFGLSKSLLPGQDMLQLHGGQIAVRWCGPEAFTGQWGYKSDVYSIGVTIWEMVTRKIPHEGLTVMNVKTSVESGVRLPRTPAPSISPSAAARVFNIVDDCTELDPRARPTASEVTRRFVDLSDVENVAFENAKAENDTTAAVTDTLAGTLESWLLDVAYVPAKQVPAVLAALTEEGFDELGTLEDLDKETLLGISSISQSHSEGACIRRLNSPSFPRPF
jgi:serine/threonine protein kinase